MPQSQWPMWRTPITQRGCWPKPRCGTSWVPKAFMKFLATERVSPDPCRPSSTRLPQRGASRSSEWKCEWHLMRHSSLDSNFVHFIIIIHTVIACSTSYIYSSRFFFHSTAKTPGCPFSSKELWLQRPKPQEKPGLR